MQKPEIVLDILSKRSQHNGIIKDVYRHLFNPEWYIFAQSDIIRTKMKHFMCNGKPKHLPHLQNLNIEKIISLYQKAYSDIHQYYKFGRNQQILHNLKYVIESSLTKTIASKLHISVCKVYKRFGGIKMIDGFPYKVLWSSNDSTDINRSYFGALPLKRKPFVGENIIDKEALILTLIYKSY